MEVDEEDSMDTTLARAKAALAAADECAERAQERAAAASDIGERIETQAKAAAEAAKSVAAELVDIQAKAEAVRGHLAEILTAKTQVEGLQAVIAAKSDHIEQAQQHADKVRANLDRLQTQATQKLTDIQSDSEQARSSAQATAEHEAAAKAVRLSIDSAKETADEEIEKIGDALERLQRLAASAEKIDEKVKAYEKRLEDLQKETDGRIATIDGLLPGATSAGLASAFDERRQSFLKPGTQWQWVFVSALAVLVMIALSGLWSVYRAATPLSYDELLRLWLARLPIAGALVWLALYASRESALAKRLEEDYGYKAAVAASFQGFHKQMSDIVQQAGAETPIAKLCTDTLTTIATPPGRIYDKHNLTVTPTEEVAKMIRAFLEKEKGTAKP